MSVKKNRLSGEFVRPSVKVHKAERVLLYKEKNTAVLAVFLLCNYGLPANSGMPSKESRKSDIFSIYRPCSLAKKE